MCINYISYGEMFIMFQCSNILDLNKIVSYNLSSKQVKRMAELALIKDIIIQTNPTIKSKKLKRYYKSLLKLVNQEISLLPIMTKYDKLKLANLFNKLAVLSELKSKYNPIVVNLSFCLICLDKEDIYKNTALIKSLNQITHFYMNNEPIKDKYYVIAENLYNHWINILDIPIV